MDRLSAQDATFLYLEGPVTPYHVASLMIFEMSARMAAVRSNSPVVFRRSLGPPQRFGLPRDRPVAEGLDSSGERQSLSSVGRYDAPSLSPVSRDFPWLYR